MPKNKKRHELLKKKETYSLERELEVHQKKTVLPIKYTFDPQTGYVTIDLRLTTKQLSPDSDQRAVTLEQCKEHLGEAYDYAIEMIDNFMKVNSLEAFGQMNMFDQLKEATSSKALPEASDDEGEAASDDGKSKRKRKAVVKAV